MALADVQRMLTRALASPEVREGLRGEAANPVRSSDPLEEAIRAVASIPPHQLGHYAEALVNKRCRAVGKCLPATLRMLGPDCFRERFRAHATEAWPRGPARHRDDAIAFAAMLLKDPGPDWAEGVTDLAAYEAAALRARDPERRIVAILLRHAPEDLIGAASGRRGTTPTTRPTLVAWIRLRKGGPSRVVRLSTPQCVCEEPDPSE